MSIRGHVSPPAHVARLQSGVVGSSASRMECPSHVGGSQGPQPPDPQPQILQTH